MQTSTIEGRTINMIKKRQDIDHGCRHVEFPI